MKEKNKINDDKVSEEYLYHNTEMLLRKYRDVVWSIEVSAIQAQISFELEMDCKLEEFLEMSYAAGADLSGTQIQEQMRTLEKNKKMLKIIEHSIAIMRKNHQYGEEFYWVLYYTYLSEKPCKTIDEIIDLIAENSRDFISRKTYFRRRIKAIECLSTILWGFTSKECSPVLDEFMNVE